MQALQISKQKEKYVKYGEDFRLGLPEVRLWEVYSVQADHRYSTPREE